MQERQLPRNPRPELARAPSSLATLSLPPENLPLKSLKAVPKKASEFPRPPPRQFAPGVILDQPRFGPAPTRCILPPPFRI